MLGVCFVIMICVDYSSDVCLRMLIVMVSGFSYFFGLLLRFGCGLVLLICYLRYCWFLMFNCFKRWVAWFNIWCLCWLWFRILFEQDCFWCWFMMCAIYRVLVCCIIGFCKFLVFTILNACGVCLLTWMTFLIEMLVCMFTLNVIFVLRIEWCVFVCWWFVD